MFAGADLGAAAHEVSRITRGYVYLIGPGDMKSSPEAGPAVSDLGIRSVREVHFLKDKIPEMRASLMAGLRTTPKRPALD